MFQAMLFLPTEFNNNVVVRPARVKPFKSFDQAVRSVIRSGREGYIKEFGKTAPIWNNVHQKPVTGVIEGE